VSNAGVGFVSLRVNTGVALCRNCIANINPRKDISLKENLTDTPSPQVAPRTISPKEFNRCLTLLKAEVGLDFPSLLARLESGLQIVWVTDTSMAHDLNPEALRRLGGLTILSAFYGAAVIFVNENKLIELEAKEDSHS
jgi:hypothetical protein